MRRLLLSAAKFLASAALMWFALRKTNFADLIARIDTASIAWLVLALAVALVQTFLCALRWQTVSAGCGAPIDLVRSTRYSMIGTFFNQTLPSAIGGDAMRLWLLARAGAGWRAATYSVFVDRAFGLIFLAVLIFVTLPWSMQLIGDADGRLGVLLLDCGALAAGAGFLVLHLIKWQALSRIWATRHFYACSKVAGQLLFSSRTGPWLAALSLLIAMFAVLIAACVARAIETPVGFAQLFQLIPPVMLITMIPVSIAGWGLREAAMALAFGYAGIGTGEGVNVSLLFGAVYFALGGLGGLVWIVSAEKAAKGDAPIEVPE